MPGPRAASDDRVALRLAEPEDVLPAAGERYGTTAVALAIDYAFREYDTPAIGAEAFAFTTPPAAC